MKRALLRNITVAATLAGSVLAALGGSVAWAAPPGARWGPDYFPNLPLVTHEGKTVRFYEDLVKDKIVVINFMYSHCQDICPLMTSRLVQVQKRLGRRVGRDVFMYSITLDPERDSPDKLKKHAEAFKVGPGWLFLTGKPEDVALIRHKLGERSRSLSEHRNDAVLGNDATGAWRRTSVMSDYDRVVATIKDMDPKWRAKKRKIADKGYQNVRHAPDLGLQGQALFVKACSSCHTIGRGDLVGPDLSGVTARRQRDWLTRFLVAPDVLRAKKDPIALALDAKYPGPPMPNLSLSETDVGDLLAYLEARTASLERKK